MGEVLTGEICLDTRDHARPAVGFDEAQNRDEQRAEPDQEELQNFIKNGRKEAAGGDEVLVEVADLISVNPGSGALVRPQAAPGIAGDTLFLVTATGIKFPVPSATAASALGYHAAQAAALPAALLGLLPTGPALNLPAMQG